MTVGQLYLVSWLKSHETVKSLIVIEYVLKLLNWFVAIEISNLSFLLPCTSPIQGLNNETAYSPLLSTSEINWFSTSALAVEQLLIKGIIASKENSFDFIISPTLLYNNQGDIMKASLIKARILFLILGLGLIIGAVFAYKLDPPRVIEPPARDPIPEWTPTASLNKLKDDKMFFTDDQIDLETAASLHGLTDVKWRILNQVGQDGSDKKYTLKAFRTSIVTDVLPAFKLNDQVTEITSSDIPGRITEFLNKNIIDVCDWAFIDSSNPQPTCNLQTVNYLKENYTGTASEPGGFQASKTYTKQDGTSVTFKYPQVTYLDENQFLIGSSYSVNDFEKISPSITNPVLVMNYNNILDDLNLIKVRYTPSTNLLLAEKNFAMMYDRDDIQGLISASTYTIQPTTNTVKKIIFRLENQTTKEKFYFCDDNSLCNNDKKVEEILNSALV